MKLPEAKPGKPVQVSPEILAGLDFTAEYKEKARQWIPLQTGNLWSLSYMEAFSNHIFPRQNIMKER